MMVPGYIRVCEEEGEKPVEIPVESDDTVLLTSLNGVFPKSTGLKYYVEDSDCFRGVRLTEGKLYPPPDGWVHVYYCSFPKDNKRKGELDQDSLSAKSKKLEGKKCIDLIVLNLAWKTDEDSLREYFSRYGELVTVQVKRHPGSQQSKGFGFIRFSDYDAQVNCLAERHTIDGRWCDVRIPMSKLEGDRQEVSRKLHVGGITENMTAATLREHFSQFGNVCDVFMPKPFRGFAFVSFEEPEIVNNLIGKDQVIDDVTVTLGSAVPKLPAPSSRFNPQGPPHVPFSVPQNPWAWPYSAHAPGPNNRNYGNGHQGYVPPLSNFPMMGSHNSNNVPHYYRNYNGGGNRMNM